MMRVLPIIENTDAFTAWIRASVTAVPEEKKQSLGAKLYDTACRTNENTLLDIVDALHSIRAKTWLATLKETSQYPLVREKAERKLADIR